MDDLNLPKNEVVTTSDWIVTLLIAAIPLVGIIMLFVWAFGGGTNLSKANWAKAALIWIAVLIVVGILWSIIFGAVFMNALR